MATDARNRKSQPVQIYIILCLTTVFFLVEVIAWYITHGLTLQINAYHMLCNVVALIGCITSHKFAQRQINTVNCSESEENSPLTVTTDGTTKPNVIRVESKSDKEMKNTFGWARIDVLAILVGCVTLTSFCFSTVVAAAQTLVHIDHLHEMHFPLPVICVGSTGLVLNLFCNYLIGGYTYNQGVFLKSRKDGYVVLQSKSAEENEEEEEEEEQEISIQEPVNTATRQDYIDIWRDVLGCMIIIISSLLIYFTDQRIAKFIDPIFAIVSAISLFLLSCPYIMESALILLQTIPNHIDIHYLQKELMETFPEIVNVHDLHVWQLNGEKVICTIHIIFQHHSAINIRVISKLTEQITEFFTDMGITHVTIQPEFQKLELGSTCHECLIRCRSQYCLKSQCCQRSDEIFESVANENKNTSTTQLSERSNIAGSSKVADSNETRHSQLIPIDGSTSVTASNNGVDDQGVSETRKPQESLKSCIFDINDDSSFLSIEDTEKESASEVFGSAVEI